MLQHHFKGNEGQRWFPPLINLIRYEITVFHGPSELSMDSGKECRIYWLFELILDFLQWWRNHNLMKITLYKCLGVL